MSFSVSRPYSCSECGKSFRRNQDLNRHGRIHNANAERFHCSFPGCTHSSLQKGNLKTHYISRHTDLRPHTCQFQGCTESFADGSFAIRHEKRVHGFYRRIHKAHKKDEDCSGAALPTLGMHLPSASSIEIKRESNLGDVSSPPSLGRSSDVSGSSTTSVFPITPITSSVPMPGLEPTSYDGYPFVPHLSMDGFLKQDPQSLFDAGSLDQGPSFLWPDATPQSYFTQLWSSVPPFNIPA